VLRGPCRVSKPEARAAARPVRAIAQYDHPRIEGSGCKRQPRQQTAKQNAQVRNNVLMRLSGRQADWPAGIRLSWRFIHNKDNTNIRTPAMELS
jgi:hypothetical protein